MHSLQWRTLAGEPGPSSGSGACLGLGLGLALELGLGLGLLGAWAIARDRARVRVGVSSGSGAMQLGGEQLAQTQRPHLRQWCRRVNRPNSTLHSWQTGASSSGVHVRAWLGLGLQLGSGLGVRG